jgi:hypothetical protein
MFPGLWRNNALGLFHPNAGESGKIKQIFSRSGKYSDEYRVNILEQNNADASFTCDRVVVLSM